MKRAILICDHCYIYGRLPWYRFSQNPNHLFINNPNYLFMFVCSKFIFSSHVWWNWKVSESYHHLYLFYLACLVTAVRRNKFHFFPRTLRNVSWLLVVCVKAPPHSNSNTWHIIANFIVVMAPWILNSDCWVPSGLSGWQLKTSFYSSSLYI